MLKRKTRTAYAIVLDDNNDAEYNVDDELLLFDNYEQIAEYANTNDINYERITVIPVDVYDEADLDFPDIPEVEF